MSHSENVLVRHHVCPKQISTAGCGSGETPARMRQKGQPVPSSMRRMQADGKPLTNAMRDGSEPQHCAQCLNMQSSISTPPDLPAVRTTSQEPRYCLVIDAVDACYCLLSSSPMCSRQGSCFARSLLRLDQTWQSRCSQSSKDARLGVAWRHVLSGAAEREFGDRQEFPWNAADWVLVRGCWWWAAVSFSSLCFAIC